MVVTLYCLIALGQTPQSISFYDRSGWPKLWYSPYEMIYEGCETALPRWWNLYLIGYEVELTSGQEGELLEVGYIWMDKRTFAARHGYSYYGGRDLMLIGSIGRYVDVLGMQGGIEYQEDGG